MKKELQTQYMKALKEAEDIRLQYQGKPQEMPGDEVERWERAMADCDSLKQKIDLLEKEEAHQAWSKQAADKFPIARVDDDKRDGKSAERQAAVKTWFEVLRDPTRQTAQQRAILQDYYLSDPASGGFFQTPQEMANEVLTLLKNSVWIRGEGRTFPLESAGSLGIPSIDVDPSNTNWTTELATGSNETTASAGKRELATHPMAKLLKMSRTLVRKVPIFEEVMLDRITYICGITEEVAFLTGNGSQQPLGLFVASPNGIDTSRDVAAASHTAIASDDLINVQFSLKFGYRKRAKWVLHRTILQAVRKLKDSNGNYIWTTGIAPGLGFQDISMTLLGSPYCESEYAPNTVTQGNYTALYGDLSFYWIADALDMQMQVLQELYAATNEIGYILRKETDGMPVQAEAFARLIQ